MEKKVKEIQHGIPEINKRKETLFELKKYFYGDFKWNKNMKRVPNPNKWIQKAIECLEQAIRDAEVIEVNSV